MIKNNLLCKKCELTFDSWFASSKEYDKLKKKQLINCHSCGSLKVEKNLMAPKLISKNFTNKNEKKDLIKYQKIKKKLMNIKNLLRITLIMLVKTLLMRQDQYTITARKKIKVYTELLQSRI